MEVYTDVELINLQSTIIADGDKQLQFTKPLSKQYCESLNNLLFNRNDVVCRFYSYDETFKNLAFLKYLFNIQQLKLDDAGIDNINVLNSFERLKTLKISKTKNRQFDLNVLLNLHNLVSLELDGQINVQNVLAKKKNFNELYLTSIDLDLEVLKQQNELKNLDLSNCKCENYQVLGNFYNLHYLQLEKLEVTEVPFVETLANLEFLGLRTLKINELPNLKKCTKLERIFLSGLSNLSSYAKLASATNLKEIEIGNVESIDINDFSFLEANRTIRKVSANIRNRKSLKIFEEFIHSLTLAN